MPAYDVLESIPAEYGPQDRREERIAVGTGLFSDPGLQDLERFPSERSAPQLARLSLAADMHPCSGRGKIGPASFSWGRRKISVA
jgi:hypothetical protein